MGDFLEITGYINKPDLSRMSIDELKNFSFFDELIYDFLYRTNGCIDIDDTLDDMNIDSEEFDYDEFWQFLYDYLQSLGTDVEIKELSFDDEDEEGYDYTATLSYKTKDLIEKFLKDKR